jgi:PhzF family phenazine biosynthesis protein
VRDLGNAAARAPPTSAPFHGGWHTPDVPRPFRQVDVFTDVPFLGNPVAVVLDAAGIDDATMRRIARWTNLSETTFVLPPTEPAADYRVRIFTPVDELPFAGHPTLGTCHAWLEAGGVPQAPDVVVQECAAGLVRVRRSPGGLAFAAPPLVRSGPIAGDLVVALAAAVGLEPGAVVDAAWVDNGPGWVALLLDSVETVERARPGPLAGLPAALKIGLAAQHEPGGEHAVEVRAFFPKDAMLVEDPVTGSLNASLAQWLLGTGRLSAPYVASQGRALGRAGKVRVSEDDGTIWIGGGTVTCVEGQFSI